MKAKDLTQLDPQDLYNFASVAAWWAAKEPEVARGERLGIFVGLWVPSFFILSNRLARKADEV